MRKRLKSFKWQLPLYFLGATSVTLFLGFFGWLYIANSWEEQQTELWIELALVLLLIGPVVGYFVARQVQRKVDALQISLKQIAKGNLSERLPVGCNDFFDGIYRDFNTMSASLENRLRLLQQLGEADVMAKVQSNQDAVMEERRRLARDLHDTVSQQLFAIHMSASSLPKLMEVNPAAASQVVNQLVTMSHHAQKQMRSLIAQLRPLELEEQTLEEALSKWFPDYCNQNGLQGKLEINLPEELSEALEHQLFLIIQEAMANVVKHAKAHSVSLSLYDVGHQYILQVDDDGRGFSYDPTQRSSYGLSTMRERAERLGGNTEIRSKPGSGTGIYIRIPKFTSMGGENEA